jgi:phage gp29-like protein
LQEPEDLKTLSEVYKNVVEMGQPVSVEHVSERFGIPLPEEGETVLQPRTGTSLKLARMSARSGPVDEDLTPADTLDRLSEKMLSMVQFDDLMGPVEEILESCSSLEEFRDRLLDVYQDMDPADLGVLIQKALTLAELSRRFDATER